MIGIVLAESRRAWGCALDHCKSLVPLTFEQQHISQTTALYPCCRLKSKGVVCGCVLVPIGPTYHELMTIAFIIDMKSPDFLLFMCPDIYHISEPKRLNWQLSPNLWLRAISAEVQELVVNRPSSSSAVRCSNHHHGALV